MSIYVWIDALTNYITALGYGSDDDSLYHTLLAGGCPSGRQGNRPLPYDLLADHADGARSAAAEESVRARLAADEGRQNVEVQRQCHRPGLADRPIRAGCAPLLPAAGSAVRLGRHVHAGKLRRADQLRSGERSRQPAQPHRRDDRQIFWRGRAGVRSGRTPFDADLEARLRRRSSKVEDAMDKMEFSVALSAIWALVGRTNKYIDETQPWVLAKEEDKQGGAGIRHGPPGGIAAHRLDSRQPFLTHTPRRMWEQLGITEGEHTAWESIKTFGRIGGQKVVKGDPIFPRLDLEEERAYILKSMSVGARPAQDETEASSGSDEPTAEGSAKGSAKTGTSDSSAAGSLRIIGKREIERRGSPGS